MGLAVSMIGAQIAEQLLVSIWKYESDALARRMRCMPTGSSGTSLSWESGFRILLAYWAP
jgi:hypothetical protein